MKKCAECGFEGKWLTHLCPGPPGTNKPGPDGKITVNVFYPTTVIDLDEVIERKFDLEKVPG